MENNYFFKGKPEPAVFDREIFVNQSGYLPHGRKRAVIKVPCEKFNIENEYGTVVYSGETVHFGKDECSGDDIYFADFSDLCSEGRYTVVTERGERSLEFSIGDNIYAPVFDKLVKAYYYLRCGSELCAEHAGQFARPSCHNSSAIEYGSDGTTKYDVSGGWHDAGDYGRYVTAGACAAAHMLYAYKLFPTAFETQRLGIPNDGGLPDVLKEVKYELLWLLKMQRTDGAVWHKATTMTHAQFVMPHEDTAQMYLFAPSSIAAADFTAICALGAEVYRGKDDAFADRLAAAAEKAWLWLEENPEFIGFQNPEGCNTGSYGERNDIDNRFWAAAQLYSLTGEQKYLDRLNSMMIGFSMCDLGYGTVGGLGSLALLLGGRKIPERLYDRIKRDFNSKATELKGLYSSCGYGAAIGGWQFNWGSNMNILKAAMTFIITDRINGKHQYTDCITAQLDYLLGVNATGYSFVTGCGEFCVKNPHLRPAYADNIDECIPGYVSGGPNGNPSDPDALILVPKGTPPMKCFVDDVSCYSLNEITIYWNSPAVFLLAYFMNENKKIDED
ncbi:MAG: glycoside hydrolase family 9 protein [Eubacterium sp.]|nr:glycoside hydrolase family 9 protein [Eubacterium sp.]